MNNNDFENKSEGQVRRTMHKAPSVSNILGAVFGIFMVIVYVGMGVLLIINFFDWRSDWGWARWIVGIVLIIYGFYRGYRTYISVKTHNGTYSDNI